MENNGLSSFISTITGALSEFTTSNLGTILVAALGITATLAIAWFAYRFIMRKVSGAMKNGKM
jgi:peptidoglycan/LPS O-acetylase OafA/YrhL